MLPDDETFVRYYSLAGLYERLREDAALHPDTMDQRYGAWAQLLALFRLVHDGADGRRSAAAARATACCSTPTATRSSRAAPRRRDAQIARADRAAAGARRHRLPRAREAARPRRRAHLLPRPRRRADRLGLRDDDGLPARERRPAARSRSRPDEALRRADVPSTSRRCWRRQPEQAREVAQRARPTASSRQGRRRRSRTAGTLEDLHAALEPVVDHGATPDLVPPGAMVLQPSEERRRSGSHYTPRSLTEPIVRTTLAADPRATRGDDGGRRARTQILDLKVCDPAMGSGAFLVEACRQLGDALVDAWDVARRSGPRSRPTRTRWSSRGGWSRSAASTAWTRTRRGRPGEAVALARDAGARAPVHVRRPRAAARRLARRALARADRGLPLGPGRRRGFEAIRDRREHVASVRRAARRRSARPATTCPTGRCATCGTRRRHELDRCGCSATSWWPPSSLAEKTEASAKRSGRVFATRSTRGRGCDDTADWLEERAARRARRSCRSTGRSSSRRCSSARRRGSMRSSGTRRSRARTRSRRRTRRDYLDWLKQLHEESTATRTSSPTSSAAPSTCCAKTARSG